MTYLSPTAYISPNRMIVLTRGKAKPIRYLAYLPHYRGEPKSASLLTTFDDPGFDPNKPDPTLQAALEKELLKYPQLAKLPFAVADLTKKGDSDRRPPRFGGRSPLDSRNPASCSKVIAMYAAYQLKLDLEVIALRTGVQTFKELALAARQTWSDTQRPTKGSLKIPLRPPHGGHPGFERHDKLILFNGSRVTAAGREARKHLAPKLERIFDPSSIAPLRFRSTGEDLPTLLYSANPKDYPYKGVKRVPLHKLGFKERLDLMIGESNKAASTSCVRDLGYTYINSALLQSGLHHPARGGLWQGADYSGSGKASYYRKDPTGGRVQGGTPAAFVTFFTLLAQGKLVNQDSSRAMLRLMKKGRRFKIAEKDVGLPPGHATVSWFGRMLEGLLDPADASFEEEEVDEAEEKKPAPVVDAFSKLGDLKRSRGDAAILKVLVPNPKPNPKYPYVEDRRYVLAALESVPKHLLFDLVKPVDDAIKAVN